MIIDNGNNNKDKKKLIWIMKQIKKEESACACKA